MCPLKVFVFYVHDLVGLEWSDKILSLPILTASEITHTHCTELGVC